MVSTKVVMPLILILAILNSQVHAEDRDQKLLSLFSVVTFPNDQCTAKSTTTTKGTCLTSTECNTKSGTIDGNCASGFGVCCTFTKSTCGSVVKENCTYIQNPSYPTKYSTAGNCEYSITPLSTDICQIRLDFTAFDLPVTSTTGVCVDHVEMTGPSGRNPNNLCAKLTGQHVYIEQARLITTTKLKFVIATTSTGSTWKVKVNQIECSSEMRAPDGCVQYFTGKTNNIISYGWHSAIMLQTTGYTYCARREAGYCGIEYTAAGGPTSPDTFEMDDAGTPLNGMTLITTGIMGWVAIPAGSAAGSVYSGHVLTDWAHDETTAALQGGTTAVAGVIKPLQGHQFQLFTTNPTTAQTKSGFKMVYNQVPCN